MSRGVPFQPGNKLGRGRPKGSRNKSKTAAFELLREHSDPLVRKCIADALRGCKMSMKLCIHRILPARREPPVSITLPPVNTASEVSKALNVVLKAISSGGLTPEEGSTISNILETKRRAIETVEQEQRIAALQSNSISESHERMISLADAPEEGV
jgi:hypothetical protein